MLVPEELNLRINQSELPKKNKRPINARYTACKAGLPGGCVGDSRKRRSNAPSKSLKNVRLSPGKIHR